MGRICRIGIVDRNAPRWNKAGTLDATQRGEGSTTQTRNHTTEKTMNKKIDIYIKHGANRWFDYYASTNTAKTCKEAKARFLSLYPYKADQVKASFAK
jgi:hypothetical protein